MRVREWGGAAAAAGVLLWVACAGVGHAAGIAWEKRGGAFQECLEAQAMKWIETKVELVVNEDPAAGEINDSAVAEWATRALKDCATKAGGGNPASEGQFMKYMAHWREYIYAAADELRQRARPD